MTQREPTIDGVTKTIIYMAPPHVPRKDISSIRWHMNKKTRSVTDSTALTSCVVQFQFFEELFDQPNSGFFAFKTCTFPVRSNVNNGSECAPLNLVMASAAFRLCGHHRGRHIALRIGTSRADFRSSWCKSLSNASNKPLESQDHSRLDFRFGSLAADSIFAA